MKYLVAALLSFPILSLVACGSSGGSYSHTLTKEELKVLNDEGQFRYSNEALVKIDGTVFTKVEQPENPNFDKLEVRVSRQENGSYRFEIHLTPKNESERVLTGPVRINGDSSQWYSFALSDDATALTLTKVTEISPSCLRISILNRDSEFFRTSGFPASPVIVCK